MQARLKGALVTRLGRPELCVINTHPVADYDGDWSDAHWFIRCTAPSLPCSLGS